ncbi:MIR motif-containing protein [Mycena sp. CBHHK59/15]|nr:MIR motif-containing protein [Mycena sp. CBHHK59/15]
MSRSILSALCFIFIPGLLFLGLFNIHLATFGGPMDLADQPVAQIEVMAPKAAIHIGSTVALRHIGTKAAGYLHSHNLFYPTGSLQHQVTLAPQRSNATAWRVYNATAKYETREQDVRDNALQHVPAGMRIKLQHVMSQLHLHSHAIPAPVSVGADLQEVTAYGLIGFPGDANDDWTVELTEGSALTVMSPFKLRHMLSGCLLSARGETLPEWGLGLLEVICEPEGEFAESLWIVEDVEDVA